MTRLFSLKQVRFTVSTLIYHIAALEQKMISIIYFIIERLLDLTPSVVTF